MKFVCTLGNLQRNFVCTYVPLQGLQVQLLPLFDEGRSSSVVSLSKERIGSTTKTKLSCHVPNI